MPMRMPSRMARIKQRIARLMPASVVSGYSIRREMKELSRIHTLDCDARNLRPRSEVDLEELFDSHEIEMRWHQSSKQTDELAIPERRGGLNLGDRKAIFYLISKLNPSSVLEIGTHIGASTVHIASALSANQTKDGREAKLVSVDIIDVNSPASKPWLTHGARQSPSEMIHEMGYEPFVDFVTGSSLSYFAACTQRFDLVFLDGDHSAATVYQEIPAALNRLNQNGVILLHDYFPELKPLWSDVPVIPGPLLATERLVKERANFVVLPVGKLPWPNKVQSNATSLALLLRRE
jgi:predicted O-methyltransferase YrrM